MKMYSKTFSDRKMFRRIALMLLYDAFILVCWTAFDPYSPELLPTATAGARTVRWDCRSDNMLLWGGLFLAPKLILLVYGSVIAFKVPATQFELAFTHAQGQQRMLMCLCYLCVVLFLFG